MTAKKDSWKKLGMDLAKWAKFHDMDGVRRYLSVSFDQEWDLCRRARALRAAERKRKVVGK